MFLNNGNLPHFHEFQNHQKSDHGLHFRMLGAQKLPKTDMLQSLDRTLHIDPFLIHVHFFFFQCSKRAPDGIDPVILPLHDGLEQAVKPGKGHTLQKLGGIDLGPVCPYLLRDRRCFVHYIGRICLHIPKLIRHIFIKLVLQKLFHKLLAGILLLALFVDLFRKQHPGFDIQKRCRHQKKFTHHIQILPLHLVNIFHILGSDLHDGNIINIYFILVDQMQ